MLTNIVLSIHIYTSLTTCLSVCQCVCLLFSLSNGPLVCLHFLQSTYLSTTLSVCSIVWLHIHQSVLVFSSLYVYQSVNVSTILSTCLPVCVCVTSLSTYVPVDIHVCMSISLAACSSVRLHFNPSVLHFIVLFYLTVRIFNMLNAFVWTNNLQFHTYSLVLANAKTFLFEIIVRTGTFLTCIATTIHIAGLVFMTTG